MGCCDGKWSPSTLVIIRKRPWWWRRKGNCGGKGEEKGGGETSGQGHSSEAERRMIKNRQSAARSRNANSFLNSSFQYPVVKKRKAKKLLRTNSIQLL
ncbi:hypothetical protein HN51_058642 [Arachis hypogaea]